jgi:hypothetical protein
MIRLEIHWLGISALIQPHYGFHECGLLNLITKPCSVPISDRNCSTVLRNDYELRPGVEVLWARTVKSIAIGSINGPLNAALTKIGLEKFHIGFSEE